MVNELVGGPARRHVIVVLACVLALDSADKATIGAIGSNLESALHVDNTQLGLLAGATPLVGALATLPAGMLADRVRRKLVLAVAIAVWSGGMALSAVAASFSMLLVTRLALGAVVAAAGPNVASLTGDFFPGKDRARIYGFILSGELLGAALGFLVMGEIAGALSWRYAFLALALPGWLLAWWIWRRLPEPARGGQSRLAVGATEIQPAEEVVEDDIEGDHGGEPSDDPVRDQVSGQEVAPRSGTVLKRDARDMSAWEAVRYTLGVPTNRLLIVVSALGYYFLAGLQTFAVIYLQRHFGVSHAFATALLAMIVIAAVTGALIGGRLADRLIANGHISARMVVPAIAYTVAAFTLGPAFALTLLPAAVALFVVGGMAVAAPNPPLDAARLDIIPADLWGRAEAVRGVLRTLAQGVAPFVFGYTSVHLVTHAGRHASGHATGFGASATGTGLEYTFLIMLVALLIGGLLMLVARRSYPADVAAVMTAERRTAEVPEVAR